MQITVCDICGKDAEHIAVLMALGEQSCKGDLCPGCHSGFLDFFGPILERLTPVALAVPHVTVNTPAVKPSAVISPAGGIDFDAPPGTYPEDFYHLIPSSRDGVRRDPALDRATRAPWALQRVGRGAWVQYPGMKTWQIGRPDLPQGPINLGRLPLRRAYVQARRDGSLVPSSEMFKIPTIPQVF